MIGGEGMRGQGDWGMRGQGDWGEGMRGQGVGGRENASLPETDEDRKCRSVSI